MNPLITDNSLDTRSPIIVALDYNNEKDVLNFITQISPDLCKLKVGKELFTACGPKLVEKLVISGYDVFLDLKFHDIPNTVYNACKVATDLGVWMMNVHTSGGSKMLNMAREAVNSSNNSQYKPLLIGVTVLTSMDSDDLKEIGVNEPLEVHVNNLARLAFNAELDGVVCSAHEASSIKAHTSPSFLTVSPGIRLIDNIADDQTRIMTPKKAQENQVDYMVIGRPITKANNPYEVLTQIVNDIL